MKWLLALALVACKSKQPPPPPAIGSDAAIPALDEQLSSKLTEARGSVSQAYLAMKELRKQQAEGDSVYPDGLLPALDFTTETGNAIVTGELRGGRDPITDAPRFRFVHVDDDPYRIAQLGNGFLSSDEEKAKYRGARYRPKLEHLARARYAMFVIGTETPAEIGLASDKIDTPAKFDGVALLYELASTKLLAGFPLHVVGGADIKIDMTARYYRRGDPVILDLEDRTRSALWTALRARASSVKAPAIVYTQIDD